MYAAPVAGPPPPPPPPQQTYAHAQGAVGHAVIPHFAPANAPNPYALRDRPHQQKQGDSQGEAEDAQDGATPQPGFFAHELAPFLPRSAPFLAQFLGQKAGMYLAQMARNGVLSIYKRMYGLGLPPTVPPTPGPAAAAQPALPPGAHPVAALPAPSAPSASQSPEAAASMPVGGMNPVPPVPTVRIRG